MKGGTLTRVWMQFAVSFWSLGKFLIPPPAPAFLHPIVSVWFSLVLLYINKSLCFPHIVHFMIWLKAIKNDGNLEKELLNSTNPSILVMERLNFSKWQLFFFFQIKVLSSWKKACRHMPGTAGIPSTCQISRDLAWLWTCRSASQMLTAVYSINVTAWDFLQR